MPSQIIIFLFSILGIILFIVQFQNVKKYFTIYVEIIGIVTMIYVISILIAHFYFNIKLEIGAVLIAIFSFVRNTSVASLATYYFHDELKISISPFFIGEELDKIRIIQFFKFSILIFVAIIITSIFFILLSGNRIINIRFISFDVGIFTVLNSFLTSFSEEVVVRLYLFGLISYWLKKVKGNFAIAAVLSSLLWSLDHFLVDVMVMKFLFLFIMGLLMSILMYKRGIESCIAVHGLYNTLAFLVLGYMN